VRVKGSWHPYCTDEWSIELGEKLCSFFGFQTLSELQTLELEELSSLKEQTGTRDGEYDNDDEPLELELLLLGESGKNPYHSSDAGGPIAEVVSKASIGDDEYQCTVAFISCSNV
jgi:hypothetical protein